MELASRPEGLTDFIYRTREFQWVAKGGRGNPYGPSSYSFVIWEALREFGEAGLDLVDLAVLVRERMLALNLDSRSILQRVVMVCERVCTHPYVNLMERLDPNRVVDPNGQVFRIAASHRVSIPVPPSDMVGVKRRMELEAERAAASAPVSS